jgi:hypothetical protein
MAIDSTKEYAKLRGTGFTAVGKAPTKTVKKGGGGTDSPATVDTAGTVGTEVASAFDQASYINELMRIQNQATANIPNAATNYDIFKSELGVVFGSFGPNDDAWIREIFNAGQTKMNDGVSAGAVPDILLDDPALVNYRSRFKGLLDLRERAKTQKVSYLPTIAEYATAERANTELLQRYGLNNLANQKTLDAIFAGDVSTTELEERVINGYNAIQNADSALKQQLSAEFPTLNNSDFLEAILSGPEGAKVLQQKVARAGIAAEAATAGLKSQLGAEELRKSGVTREQARSGFQAVAQQKAGIEQAGRIFGDVEVGTLQTELEKEALLGQTSKRTKALASQARAEFGGSSGITTGSLGRKRQV